jgi:hypothetical protein
VNWLHAFWFGYVWSSVKGNAPEDGLSLIIVAMATALLIPPVRMFFERHFSSVHEKLRARHEEAKAQHIEAKAHRDLVEAKLEEAQADRLEIHRRLSALHNHLGAIAPLTKGSGASGAGSAPPAPTSGGSPSARP